MSRAGDQAAADRSLAKRQWLARDIRRLADASLAHNAVIVRRAAETVGVHPEDARALLAEVSRLLDPERVRS